MKNALLVLSGGMDSTTMLHEFSDRIALALFFNYGSNHNRLEGECARRQCELTGTEFLTIDLDFMRHHFKSSLLEGSDAVPEADYNTDNMASTVVPFRNGIMLSIAAGIAESRGLTTVMIANHSGDHAIYPDCRPQFVAAMGAAIAEGTYARIRLEAPYTSLSKADIAERGLRMGVDYTLTYSCYKGTDKPCGRCATCRERAGALAEAQRRIASSRR